MRKVLVMFGFILLLSSCSPDTTEIHIVMFESNGGNDIASIEVEDGKSILEPITPLKDGNTFLGWYTDSTFNDSFKFTIPIVSDIKLHAKWEINQYTLKYIDHDGTILQTKDFEYNVDLSFATAPTNPIREGYTFNGWIRVLYTFTSGGITVPATMPANDVTFIAMYTINQYTIEYVDFDGTILQTEDFDYNSDLSVSAAPTDPTREEYAFYGWDISVPPTMPANDVIITATYLEKRIITGTGTDIEDRFGSNIIVEGDYIIILASDYNLQGAIFVYKFSDPDYERVITETDTDDRFGSNIIVEGDYIVIGEWEYNAYQGAIFMYKLSDPTYKRMVTGSDSRDKFGLGIIIEGDYLVTGAYESQSVIIVYKFSDPTYERVITGTGTDDRFGRSILIEGDYIVIGASGYNESQGATFVYKFSDPTYERMIIGTGTDSNDYFGESILAEGDYIIIKSEHYNESHGAIFAYKFSDPTYERMISVTENNDYAHSIIYIEGDYIMIGYNYYPYVNLDELYVFKFSDPTYKRIITDLNANDGFSIMFDIFVEGDYLVFGDFTYNDSQGAVFVYKLSDPSYERIIIGTGTSPIDFFADVLFINGDYIIVGAYDYNSNMSDIYVYKFSDLTYERKISITDSNGNYGYNALIDGEYIIVGAYGYNNYQGKVYIFRFLE